MKNHKRTPKLICLVLMLAMLVSVLAVSAAADDATVPASGYCAVGEVGSDRAAILIPDGTVVQAPFTGTAPVSGTVMSYTVADGTYTFAAVSFGGYSAWRINDNDDANGDYYWDGGSTYAFIDAAAAGFVKFSNTSWSVYTGNHMIEIADGVGDYPNTAWTANVDAHWNGDIQKMDVLFADCTVTYTTGPANPSVLFNGTATPDTAGNKDVVLTAEPAPIVTTTYCAVGEVGSDKAAILLSDGTVVQAPFTGTAPVSGTVMSYTVTDGTYTFATVSFGGYQAWRIWDNDDQNGDYYHDGGSTYAFIDAAAAGFVKFSNTSWSVYTGNHMIEIADGVGDYPNTAWTANVDAHWNGDIQKMDVLFADCTVTYTTGPANPSVLFNGTATPDTIGNKDVVLTTTDPEPTDPTDPDPTDPEPTDPEPTDPEPTDPEPTDPAGDGYTASGKVASTGYAAIGAVNAEAGKATVLLGNGEHGTVCFAGTAPKSGAVYGYELHDNNVFVFIEKKGNFDNSDQLAATQAWNMWFEPMGWAWDANQPNDIFHVVSPTPIFLRYGDNQWALTTIDKVTQTGGASWAYGYALDTIHQPDMDAQNNLSNFTTGALVMGNMNADGTIDATGFAELFGSPAKIDLGTISDDLLVSPETGDNMNMTAVVIAMLLSAAAVVALVRKKED